MALTVNSAGGQHDGRCLKKGSSGGSYNCYDHRMTPTTPTALIIEEYYSRIMLQMAVEFSSQQVQKRC